MLSVIRPDLVDFLFLESFLGPFQMDKRDKVKFKRKKGEQLHENAII